MPLLFRYYFYFFGKIALMGLLLSSLLLTSESSLLLTSRETLFLLLVTISFAWIHVDTKLDYRDN
jgi:hypothetical protein